MNDLKQIQDFFSKPLKENTTNWPKEVPSRHGDIIFRLVKVMPDRAKYELIDAETGKTWETGGRVYGTVNQLKASAEDTIKPQGGRQSSQFESVNEESNKFADYSNNELLGYVKELYKQRSDAASKGQNALVNGLHKDIEAANRELKKRTQKLKDLTRTDESVNETQQYKKGDKLKIKLKNGKEFDVTFDSYGRQKGIAFGKFKDRSGEYDTKPFNLDTIVESVNEELNLSNYGTVTPPKGGASLVGKYNSIQGKSKYDTVIFDYQEGSDKPYGIVQVEGHGIYGSDLLKRLGLRQTRSWTAGVDVYIHDGNYTPVYVSEDDFKALLDFWSGGWDREAKAQVDFYRSRGRTSGTIDEQSLDDQAKAYFLAKVKRGEIDTLPEDPKAAFLAQMMKDQMDHDKETLRRERGLEERISKALNELNEELCAKGKRYIKARKRAGEKSSAYLSGRAVKVCKGQIDWPKKGKKKVNESDDNGAEEKAFDAELMATANGIASALGKELKAKQGDKEKLDEAVITTAIAGVLTANALVGFISKMAAKLFKKLNFKKGEDIAEKIHHWAHDNETAFQAPIKRVLKFFIKDEQKLDTITKAVYAIVVASMAAGYGADAVSGLAKADWFKGALSSLKALAKSDEAIVNAYPAIKSLVA